MPGCYTEGPEGIDYYKLELEKHKKSKEEIKEYIQGIEYYLEKMKEEIYKKE